MMNVFLPQGLWVYIDNLYDHLDIPHFLPMEEVDDHIYLAYRAWTRWRSVSLDRACLDLSKRADEILPDVARTPLMVSFTLLDSIEHFLAEEMNEPEG